MVNWLDDVVGPKAKFIKFCKRYKPYIQKILILFILILVGRFAWLTLSSFPPTDKHGPLFEISQELSDKSVLHDISATMSDTEFKGRVNSSTYPAYLEYIRKHNRLTRDSLKIHGSLNKTIVQSTYTCLGKQNMIEAHDRRACRFKNVCINQRTKAFEYYQISKRPVFYDKSHGPLFDFTCVGGKFITMAALWFFPDYFSPVVKVSAFPDPKKRTLRGGTHVLWNTNLRDFNFGHFVFEELGSVHYTLNRFGIRSKNATILYMKEDPKNNLFSKFTKAFLPAITSAPLQFLSQFTTLFGKEYVCFEDLVVGGYSRMFYGFLDEFNEGKEPLVKSYRNDILLHHGVDPFYAPKRHKILINVKTDSVYLKNFGRNRYRVIVNAKELQAFLLKRYPEIEVVMVNLSQMSITDQLKEMQTVSIFISHPGGSCMVLPFLPHNSHAILMDYYATSKDSMFGYKKGDSVSMEVSFWNLFPHFEKIYYQIYDSEKEMQWDSAKKEWLRDDASVIVDFDRIEFMVNEVLEKHTFM